MKLFLGKEEKEYERIVFLLITPLLVSVSDDASDRCMSPEAAEDNSTALNLVSTFK